MFWTGWFYGYDWLSQMVSGERVNAAANEPISGGSFRYAYDGIGKHFFHTNRVNKGTKMKIRMLSLVVSFGYVLIVLFFFKRQLFELAQQAFINEIGVGYIFHMGTAYGVLLASSICLAAVSVKSFVSYIRVSSRKSD